MKNKMNILPAFMNDSLLSFTLVNSEVLDGAPDVATCSTNGYMHEVKNKKILKSLNLCGRGIFIRCIYLLQGDAIVIYYVVRTQCHKLLIVRRSNSGLQIMKTYNDVEKVEIYDFECLGFPQMKVKFHNMTVGVISKFPVENTAVFDVPKVEDYKSSLLAESLEEKLQILNKHLNELKEEHNLLKKLFSHDICSGEFEMIPVGSVKFSQSTKRKPEPVLKMCCKWIKVFGTSLTLGMKILNQGSEVILDMDLLVTHKRVKDYVYKIFHPSDNFLDDFFATPKAPETFHPGEEVWVVGALHLPPFVSLSAFFISCCLNSKDLRRCLLRETFEVSVLDLASQTHAILEEKFAVEDLMAISTVKSETRLEVRIEGSENGSLSSVLTKELGFRKIKYSNHEIFYCTSVYLHEVFVALRHIRENPTMWKVVMFTSEDSQIYFLVNALYELLPENTSILCEEN